MAFRAMEQIASARGRERRREGGRAGSVYFKLKLVRNMLLRLCATFSRHAALHALLLPALQRAPRRRLTGGGRACGKQALVCGLVAVAVAGLMFLGVAEKHRGSKPSLMAPQQLSYRPGGVVDFSASFPPHVGPPRRGPPVGGEASRIDTPFRDIAAWRKEVITPHTGPPVAAPAQARAPAHESPLDAMDDGLDAGDSHFNNTREVCASV